MYGRNSLLFNQSFIESILTFSLIQWFLSQGQNFLSNIMKVCSRIIRIHLYKRRRGVKRGLGVVPARPDHVLSSGYYISVQSERRLAAPLFKTNEFMNDYSAELNRSGIPGDPPPYPPSSTCTSGPEPFPPGEAGPRNHRARRHGPETVALRSEM